MNSSDIYRRALSQGMTPMEAEDYVAEEQEYERIEREFSASQAKQVAALEQAQDPSGTGAQAAGTTQEGETE